MNNSSHITVILDRSGSMASVATDVIGAVNRFIDDQKAVPGDCTMELVQFDSQDPFEVVYTGPIQQAKHLCPETYIPRASTPLLDAIGKGICRLGNELAARPESMRPSKVIFVIQTDGLENASTEYTPQRIKEMVRHQSEKYHWQFVFLGAGQDAITSGASLGVRAANAISNSVSPAGYQATFAVTSAKVADYRLNTNKVSMDAFTDQERAQAQQ